MTFRLTFFWKTILRKHNSGSIFQIPKEHTSTAWVIVDFYFSQGKLDFVKVLKHDYFTNQEECALF